MTNIHWIRTKLFAMSQKDMADICGTTQANLSRIEKGQAELRLPHLQAIRSAAIERFGDLWNDRYFFDPIEKLPEPGNSVE